MAKLKPRKADENSTTKNRGTLDQRHTEKLIYFDDLKKSLPTKKNKLVLLQKELDELINMDPNKYTHEDIQRKSYLRDAIQDLQNEIESIEGCNESLNYISNTLPILIKYYDGEVTEDGEDIDEEIINEGGSDRKNILSYFVKENTYKQKSSDFRNKYQNGSKTNNPLQQKITRAKLYDNYLIATDPNYRKSNKIDQYICSQPECGGEVILNQSDGCLVCRKCGISETLILPIDKPNYKEPVQDTGTYAYKRINHLTEILSQLQAKESTDIPQKVFDAIRRELKKRKINKDDLDIFKLRRILKKLNYRKYYEHVPHILQVINGKEPPNFSRKDELRIKMMFKAIQKPFAIYCPKNRKNFLNYSYVLHKFCELLDLDEYIGYFPLLKNNTKLLQHDKIWKNICRYMKWKFYKSM
ncbi:MAG: hypothetical protein QW303_00290 [Nitrososphaerota archaeon]